MKHKTIAVIAVILLVGSATVAFARYGRGARGMQGFGLFRQFGLAKAEARLNLTQDQIQQIRQIVKDQRAARKNQLGAVPNTREALIKAIFADNPNQSEIESRIQDLEQQHAQMLQDMVSTAQQVNKVFTPEQRAELQKMIDENAQARAKMRERWMQRMQQRQSGAQPNSSSPQQ